MLRKILSVALCLCLITGCLSATASSLDVNNEPSDETLAEAPDESLAESADELASTADDPDDGELRVRYTAVATLALKMRRAPSKSAGGNGSVDAGERVYILELGAEWCLIRNRNDGYVLSSYLTDLRAYDPATDTIGDPVEMPATVIIPTADGDQHSAENATVPGASYDENGFYFGWKASTVKGASVYKEPSEDAAFAFKLSIYTEVYVASVENDWCYIRYDDSSGHRYGYIKLSSLFKWDKVDPYVGDIPGAIRYPLMAFLGRTTDILSLEDGKTVLRTLLPGAAICVEEADEQGRYYTPYWRETGYITDADIASLVRVADWADAQPGDLISTMSTYYAVGVYNADYQGRNYNIYLGATRITGTVMQPGDVFNQYEVMGPYRKSIGYHLAPIMSPTAARGYGGGTCQVNTTMYNALIRLPIYINHRLVHSNVGAKYMLKGFDAAVGGGNINMIFTNTLPYAIRFVFWITDGVMTCCVYRAE